MPDPQPPETVATYLRLRGLKPSAKNWRRKRRVDVDDDNAPFTTGRDPGTLGDVLAKLTKDSGWEKTLAAEDLVRQWAELKTMRWNALRTLGGAEGGAEPGAPSVAKLLWGRWHRRLGELAMEVRGAEAAVGPREWSAAEPYALDPSQQLFLFSRADTIYGGSDEVQRTIIAERVLGLAREPRG